MNPPLTSVMKSDAASKSLLASQGDVRERDSFTRRLGLATVIAVILTGAISFMVLTGETPLEPTRNVAIITVAINGVLISFLIFLIVREIVRLVQARRRGRAAARLHIRIIGLFSLVAAVPAILVAIIAGFTLDVGLDRWFAMRTQTIVASSVDVARAYMNESYRGLQGSTVSMARDLDKASQLYFLDRSGFQELLTLQARSRGMIGASIINSANQRVLSAKLKQENELPLPPQESLNTAKDGEPVLISPGRNSNLVGSIFKLHNIDDAYLYTISVINPDVIKALRLMEANSSEYNRLKDGRFSYQLAFALLYVGVCMIVLLSAIWMGISVADRFVTPIKRLITASNQVSKGDLDVQVSTDHAEGDLRDLSNTFNIMTAELKTQREELVSAKDYIDQRARFTEAVLSGVTAAVIGVDPEGNISIVNPPGASLLGIKNLLPDSNVKLEDIAPEIGKVYRRAVESGRATHHEQINDLVDGMDRTLNVQVTSERQFGEDSRVITIDDITDLVTAQRNTAWSDVARRIAHEIKNPLTPIQLSAERIKRRFGKQIEQDKPVFDQCTETIVRQVADIGRMVDEFSSFARMPAPQFRVQDVRESVKEAVFLQKVAHPEISFETNLGNEPLMVKADSRLIAQAVTNVVKNATESIEAVQSNSDLKGAIVVNCYEDAEYVVIDVIDNGKGLPKQNRQQLLEPYMTTREKGTGLGLAIVRKILEDHGGSIQLMDAPAKSEDCEPVGALMRLKLPVTDTEQVLEEKKA